MNDDLYKLELNELQVGVILNGLGKLPLEQSFDLFAALRGAVIQRQQSKIAQQNTPKPMGELFEEEETKVGLTD